MRCKNCIYLSFGKGCMEPESVKFEKTNCGSKLGYPKYKSVLAYKVERCLKL
jgi:hypothetical protein